MFSDWTIADRCNNLKEYSDTLYDAQVAFHGVDYMLVHDELKRVAEQCESYTEFGVNQGTTLATVMLTNTVKKIRAVDIKLAAYNPAKPFFEQYAKDNSIDYSITEASTLDISIEPTDMLYIDTVHNCNHLMKEINKHINRVHKYVIFHDTEISQGPQKLSVCIKQFVSTHPEWEVVTDCVIDVGFMTIKRK